MGYTHYWTLKEKIIKKEVIQDVEVILKEHRDIIQFEHNRQEDPVVSETLIRFNGIGENGHETFYLTPSNEFEFCKTARKPYDLPVCEVLLVFKYHYKDLFDLSSDGFWVSQEEFENSQLDGSWQDALKSIKNRFGYKFTLIPIVEKERERNYYKFEIEREEA